MWVVSPWSRGGWVCSEIFDHTSILRFLERRFGVIEPNITPYRRAMCGDLCSAFDFESPNDGLVPTLPTRTQTEADAIRSAQEGLAEIAVPLGASGALPTQEAGTRPSRALPYDLDVHAAVDDAGHAVSLSFVNTGTAGAVFHVYDRHALTEIPRRYAVEAGKSLTGAISTIASSGLYSLFVIGPNGFHRELTGTAGEGSSHAGLEVETSYDPEGGRLRIRCRNSSGMPRRFVVSAARTRTILRRRSTFPRARCATPGSMSPRVASGTTSP